MKTDFSFFKRFVRKAVRVGRPEPATDVEQIIAGLTPLETLLIRLHGHGFRLEPACLHLYRKGDPANDQEYEWLYCLDIEIRLAADGLFEFEDMHEETPDFTGTADDVVSRLIGLFERSKMEIGPGEAIYHVGGTPIGEKALLAAMEHINNEQYT